MAGVSVSLRGDDLRLAEFELCTSSARSQVEQHHDGRERLFDPAQELMLTEGYAAVRTRRIATKAGVNSALVFYYHYLDSLDGLFIALFQRGAEGSLEHLEQGLSSTQPLSGLLDLIHDQSGSAMTMEIIALASHRRAIRFEIVEYSHRSRRMQLDVPSTVLAG